MNGTHPNGNITYNAAVEIKKGQPVKFTGSTTTTGMPTVTPCTAATDAAIGVALHLHFGSMHDEESEVITINMPSKHYSPWAQKELTMKKNPRR